MSETPTHKHYSELVAERDTLRAEIAEARAKIEQMDAATKEFLERLEACRRMFHNSEQWREEEHPSSPPDAGHLEAVTYNDWLFAALAKEQP